MHFTNLGLQWRDVFEPSGVGAGGEGAPGGQTEADHVARGGVQKEHSLEVGAVHVRGHTVEVVSSCGAFLFVTKGNLHHNSCADPSPTRPAALHALSLLTPLLTAPTDSRDPTIILAPSKALQRKGASGGWKGWIWKLPTQFYYYK